MCYNKVIWCRCLCCELSNPCHIKSKQNDDSPSHTKKIQSKMSCSVNIMHAYCKKKNPPQPLFPSPTNPSQMVQSSVEKCGVGSGVNVYECACTQVEGTAFLNIWRFYAVLIGKCIDQLYILYLNQQQLIILKSSIGFKTKMSVFVCTARRKISELQSI